VNAINENVLEIIKSDSILSSGEIGFINYDGKNYIISVGISTIEEDTPSGKLNCIKEAQLIAQNNLVKFIYDVQISNRESLKKEKIIHVKNGKSELIQIKKRYVQIIKERGEGILSKLESIGKWKSSDRKNIHYAYGIYLD
jgi:hypothetical protein